MKLGALLFGRGLVIAMTLAISVVGQGAFAQVYIPPPDDVIEDVPPLPPAVAPPLPTPGPPPAAPLPSMTREEAEAEARSFGGTKRTEVQGLTQAPDAVGQVPNYNGAYPGASTYYDNPAGLSGAGATAAVSSEGFATVHDPNRPVVPVARTDIQRAIDVEADPSTYLEGEALGGADGSCVPLPPGGGSTNYAEWTCNVGTGVVHQPQSCTRDLTVAEWNEFTYQYLCVKSFGFDGCTGLASNSMCHLTSSLPIPDFGLTVDYYDCDATVTDPNAYLYATIARPPPPEAFQVVNNVYRCNNDGLTEALTADAFGFPLAYVTGLQQCGGLATDNTCSLTTAAAAGLAERTLCKTWEFFGDPFFGGSLVCTEFAQPEQVYSCTSNVAGHVPETSTSRWFTQTWIDASCSVDLGSCTLSTETCTAANEVRIVGGVAVSRPCWQYTKTYMCQTVVGGLNDCTELAGNPQCTLDREICLDDPVNPGGCAVAERVYRCPIAGTTPEPTQYICGEDVYCVNGDCETVEREASDEFKDAVVALNALGQANAEFNENTLTLFSGTRETCSKKVFGLSNCCSGSGVPLLTPFICSAAERLLDQKDDAGLCHKLGTYCSDKVLGICVTRKDAYCCFQSKISRILQEQGRPQIGKPWGPPKTGTCEGFTIFEFQQLDLSVMDFSEIYAEFQDAARLPDEAAAMVTIQQKIRDYYSRGGPPGGPQ
jgi:conjugal transfer mating pair stabilization protein TraN